MSEVVRSRRVSGLVLMSAAWIAVAAFGVIAVWTIAETFGSPSITVTVDTFAELGEVGSNAAVVDGHYSSAVLRLSGLDAGPRFLLALGQLFSVGTAIVVAVVIALFARRVWRGFAFTQGLTSTLLVLAAVLAVGPNLARVLGDLGRWMALDQLTLGEPFLRGVGLDLVPIGVGLTLGLLAAIFGVGQRLQRDADGLV